MMLCVKNDLLGIFRMDDQGMQLGLGTQLLDRPVRPLRIVLQDGQISECCRCTIRRPESGFIQLTSSPCAR